ncbi:MAG TPA: preprotein translocase subunit SecA [Parachlamydiaceae bacterium]|nr:preprotein translocase subunit SecA [Parachlamydiaceae bacterium]
MFGFIKKIFGTAQDRTLRKYRKIVDEINSYDEKLKGLDDDALKAKTTEFKERLQKGETVDDLLPEVYAVVKDACRRLVGTEIHVSGYDQKWDMIPYDVQLIGAIALHKGSISEMMTGEGKTLTATMPLYLNALTGKPVHLVTVNDYLAQRDCQWIGTIFRWLGLTTGALTNDSPQDQRKELYKSDIVYGTASEFGFDYLRDNSIATNKDQQVQRGYYFAIIDEVDSILIDEARTPLIISGPTPVSRQMYDELKSGVGHLVRKQRDLCNRYASEARKVLEKTASLSPDVTKNDKKQQEEEEEALRKLWLVSKGTPHNKILMHIKEDPDMRAGIDKWDLFYYGDQNKEEKTKALSDLYIVIDEKGNEFELTDKGSIGWHESTEGIGSSDDFLMLDISEEFIKIDADNSLDADAKIQKRLAIQEEDFKRKERSHNLRQLLRAHLLMEKDVDYIIQDEKIIIIDENTGRPQPGRRFSDGLHQAIEAKEGVSIQKETQTFATITLQNYFRMYEKLAGMTGTATTEAGEFKQVYKLEVIEIPTHRKPQRKDFNDEIYMSEREKYNAILKDVRETHESGRPILIGTESVEISEKLSRIFKQNKLEHTVLNAKQNDKEAEIIAHAGKRGAITIATNMAGRGTDIKLEEGVAAAGGLYVMGTTRHQSRRIDRQLRGRCARQGDPGTSKFYVSFEDSLLRLFASPRLTTILQRFRPPEGEPISASMLNKSIETAQKRIEQRNAAIRKHTLEYDDVMNKQRQEIYAFRNEILNTQDIEGLAIELLQDVCQQAADKHFNNRNDEKGWDPEGYRQFLISHFPVSFSEGYFDDDLMDIEELEKRAAEKIIEAFKNKLVNENSKMPANALMNTNTLPAHETVRTLMVRKIDQLWQEHLLRMDHLRTDVNLRTVGQRDPLMEFKRDAFHFFEEFSRTLRTEAAQDLFRFEIIMRPQPSLQEILAGLQLETSRSFLPEANQPPAEQQLTTNQAAVDDMAEEPRSERMQPILAGPRTGRNDNCPCGSGKKYKKCCGTNPEDNS